MVGRMLLVVCFGSLLQLVLTQTYSYTGQGSWPGTCTSGSRQSPIDIQDFKGACDNSIQLDLKLSPSSTQFAMTLTNVASPGYITAVSTNGTIGTLYASDLSGKIYGYTMKELRVHAPSEHTIAGTSYAVEVQMIFTIRSEFTNAPNSMAGVSLLFQQSDSQQASIDLLTTLASGANSTNSTVAIANQISSILPSPLSFFSYLGSETSPVGTCSENMIWYVIQTPISVSSTQEGSFDSLWKSNTSFASGQGNNRNIQSLNSRVIKKGGVACEEQFIYFFSFVLLYAFINYFIFKLL